MNEEERWALEYFKSVKVGDNFDIQKELKCREVISGLLLKQQKEIEKYRKLRADIIKVNKKIYDVDIIEDMCEQLANSISKDKIKEKIDLIDKEYAEIIEKNKNDLYLVNINAQRHSAMQTILEELLGE